MTVPVEVASAWGWDTADLAPLAGGLINATFAVRSAGEPVAVLQQLHPIFDGAVNDDIDAVTAHLAGKGLATPRLIRTRHGDAYRVHAGRVWRALSWIDGITIHAVRDPSWAEAGGELVGRFHRAVADLRRDYAFARAGVHDTAAHLARLRELVDPATRSASAPAEPADVELGREILAAAAALPALPACPPRHGHGDLKISNLMFDHALPPRGICLVDLDTLGRQTIAFELGDAMRSWCNPHGEDAGAVAFELPIFEAAIRGFRAVAGGIVAPDEWRSIVIGLETVCVELAARFAIDVFRDEYFGWDGARFPSRRAHNVVRARGQLALGLAVRRAREDALAIVQAG